MMGGGGIGPSLACAHGGCWATLDLGTYKLHSISSLRWVAFGSLWLWLWLSLWRDIGRARNDDSRNC